MSSHRQRAILAGIFFIVAAITAIGGVTLYHPILNDPRYVVEASRSDTRVLLGACCEIAVAISVVGTAVTLFPVARRWGESTAVAYVVGRLVEATVIVAGIISLLTIVTLRHDASGATGHTAALIATGNALVALHNWTFLFGPGLAIGINTTLLASVMYRSRLVPRPIGIVGLIGGPVVFASSVAVLFGAYEQTSAFAALAAIPVTVWEMSLAAWMIAKGFDPSRMASSRQLARARRQETGAIGGTGLEPATSRL